MLEVTEATIQAIEEVASEVTVEAIALPLQDPTDYAQILGHLRRECGQICERFPGAHLYVSTASGTPQMHACWLLLAASGEVPARLLHSRPPQFVSPDKPMVSEVDLAGTPFPKITPAASSLIQATDPVPERSNVAAVLEEIGIVAEHASMRPALETAVACAEFPFPVLITGETGTGKDLFARLVHRLGDRSAKPFVVVNCAAIPENLVESTLFGHVKGAFTDAQKDRAGKFEGADGGTLFLDEIGDLPLPAQAKLLRVLEDGLVDRVGSDKPIKVDVRVIAATNRKLGEAIAAKRFRDDLFFRLNSAEIRLPPLRERRSDIPRIALRLMEGFNRNSRRQRQLSPEALIRLQGYDWPGNVRDLRTVISRAVMFSGGREILGPEDIRFDDTLSRDPFAYLPEPYEGFDVKEYGDEVRRRLFASALRIAGNNQSQAAKLLGVKPQAVGAFVGEQKKEANKLA
jgi:transcriptional regulator with GAF, ATPase, and Fis domain